MTVPIICWLVLAAVTLSTQVLSQGDRCKHVNTDDEPRATIIASPNYPKNYTWNINMCWMITAPLATDHVYLTFESFTLEGSSSSDKTCDKDFLEISDGLFWDAPRLSVFCGKDVPSPVKTSGPHMLIYFHSDSTGQYPGFRAHVSNKTFPLPPSTFSTTERPRVVAVPEPLSVGLGEEEVAALGSGIGITVIAVFVIATVMLLLRLKTKRRPQDMTSSTRAQDRSILDSTSSPPPLPRLYPELPSNPDFSSNLVTRPGQPPLSTQHRTHSGFVNPNFVLPPIPWASQSSTRGPTVPSAPVDERWNPNWQDVPPPYRRVDPSAPSLSQQSSDPPPPYPGANN